MNCNEKSDYRGKYDPFSREGIKTYPIAERNNKVSLDNFIRLGEMKEGKFRLQGEVRERIERVGERIVSARRADKPVLWMGGAHPIKNGLSPIILDWLEKGVITSIALNPAAVIHDFELALIGETSEDVPNALPRGKFGFAHETGKYLNDALRWGAQEGLGYGESVARLIGGEKIFHRDLPEGYSVDFPHKEVSVTQRAFRADVPLTVHAGIGTDIIDQHPNFSGAAKGRTSALDFSIFVNQVCGLTDGGVFLNVGTAVTGPEVFLKALSMAANAGYELERIDTADFDLRSVPERFPGSDEESYYFRDFKSVVTRIPSSFGGRGEYVEGDHRDTLPALHRVVEEKL